MHSPEPEIAKEIKLPSTDVEVVSDTVAEATLTDTIAEFNSTVDVQIVEESAVANNSTVVETKITTTIDTSEQITIVESITVPELESSAADERAEKEAIAPEITETATTKVEWLNSSEPVVQLYSKTWIPSGEIKATVLFCHGMGEHIKRYDHMFEYFRENGIRVTAFDQRGFGETGTKSSSKGDCEDMETLVKDVKVIDQQTRIDGIAHFIMGHSMGGLTALRYVHEYPEGIAGIISSAPALKAGTDVMPNYIVKKILLKIASWTPKTVIPNLVDTTTLTRDPAVLKVYKSDPLNCSVATLKMLSEVLRYGKQMRTLLCNTFKTPLLVSHGSNDKITCHETSKQFVDDVKSSDKEFVSFKDYMHELHNEPEDLKMPVYDLYVKWILARI